MPARKHRSKRSTTAKSLADEIIWAPLRNRKLRDDLPVTVLHDTCPEDEDDDRL